ncbi:hypothetical protein [Maritalea sp.]|uniref:hypothetical protein n=1 Tax=Maritalea sp. TaxID=2003361 RepID=UPI003EF5C77B
MNFKFGGFSFFVGLLSGLILFVLLTAWVNRDKPYILTMGEQLKIVVDDINKKNDGELSQLNIFAKANSDKWEDIGNEKAHVVTGEVSYKTANEQEIRRYRFYYAIFGTGEISTHGLTKLDN